MLERVSDHCRGVAVESRVKVKSDVGVLPRAALKIYMEPVSSWKDSPAHSDGLPLLQTTLDRPSERDPRVVERCLLVKSHLCESV